VSTQATRTALAGILIAISRSEKPLKAITIPKSAVEAPPAIASLPIHLGYLMPSSNATPKSVAVAPSTRTQHAGQADLHLPHSECRLKGALLLGRGHRRPVLDHRPERDPIYRLQGGGQGQACDRSRRRKTRPDRGSACLQQNLVSSNAGRPQQGGQSIRGIRRRPPLGSEPSGAVLGFEAAPGPAVPHCTDIWLSGGTRSTSTAGR